MPQILKVFNLDKNPHLHYFNLSKRTSNLEKHVWLEVDVVGEEGGIEEG